MKTEQEICAIINKYEETNPAICGTDSLIKFIQWYEEQRIVIPSGDAFNNLTKHYPHGIPFCVKMAIDSAVEFGRKEKEGRVNDGTTE